MIHEFDSSKAQARRFLEDSGAQCCLPENLPPRLRLIKGEAWCLPVDWKWTKKLIVHFDEFYPDVPPQIFLPSLEDGLLIPHVDNNLFVCTLRPGTTVNPDKATEVLKECLAIAQSVLDRDWPPADVQEHVASELAAYWQSNEVKTHQILFHPDTLVQKTFRVDPMVPAANLFKISRIDHEKPFNVELSGIGLVIDVIENDVVPLVQHQGKFIAGSKGALASIEDFAAGVPQWVKAIKKVNFYFTLRCALKGGERVLCGRLKEKLLLKKKTPAQITEAICNALSSGHFLICKAEDISHRRLIRRSSGSKMPDVSPFRIALVGCGSLGSFLADALSRAGLRLFFLCDDERVEAGNLGRHTSCLHLIGQKKTFSVAFKLRGHFEDIDVIECQHDFRAPEAQSALETFGPHLTIFATGDTNTDLLGSHLVSTGKVGSACFAWGESGLSAGHLVFQEKGAQSLLLELHSQRGDEGKYAYRIERDTAGSLEHELGCSTIYSPYSGNDMALFTAISAKRIIKWLLDGKSESCVLRLSLKDMQPWEEIHG